MLVLLLLWTFRDDDDAEEVARVTRDAKMCRDTLFEALFPFHTVINSSHHTTHFPTAACCI
jgi:hypothetical protein